MELPQPEEHSAPAGPEERTATREASDFLLTEVDRLLDKLPDLVEKLQAVMDKE